eukprot:4944862-Prymnesium_polylepis.1
MGAARSARLQKRLSLELPVGITHLDKAAVVLVCNLPAHPAQMNPHDCHRKQLRHLVLRLIEFAILPQTAAGCSRAHSQRGL